MTKVVSHHKLVLDNVLHVPSITRNLISVSKFSVDNNVVFEFRVDKLCEMSGF